MGFAQGRFSQLAGNALGTQINQHDVAFSAPGDNPQTALNKRFGQHVGILDDLRGIRFELGLQGFLEGHRFTCNNMHQRAALNTREYGRVNDFFMLGFHHDDAAPGATQ